MATPERPGTVTPQEIITDLGDRRLFEITLAGSLNNEGAAIKHLTELGLVKPERANPGEPALSLLDFGDLALLREMVNDPMFKPEIKKEHDKWYADLYMGGIKRVFGYKAANRQTELRTTHREYYPHPIPTPVYIGELPPMLSDEDTVDALQQRLDIQYGNHGGLLGPPPLIMALYEDLAVSLRPAARTLIQGDTEVWQLETLTHLRGPVSANMAA